MGEDLAAATVDVAGASATAFHMGVELAEQPRQDVRKRRPVAVDDHPFHRGVEALGVLEVGVDETGKEHPAQKRELERRCHATTSIALERRRPQVFPRHGHLVAPDGIERRGIVLRHAVVQRADSVGTVGQSRVMACDRVGQKIEDQPIGKRTARCPVTQHRRAGRRMIDQRRTSAKPCLESRRVFAEVVQATDEIAGMFEPERGGEARCQIADRTQMTGQRLPTVLARALDRMGIVHVRSPPAG
nr:hypothetical protein [Pararhizobium mangrovi]